MFFVNLYNILEVKNALVRCVYYVTEYTVSNIVMKFHTGE